MEIESITPQARVFLERYRTALPQRLEMGAIRQTLMAETLTNAFVLDIGMPNPAMSFLLRQHGGAWTSIATDAEGAQQATALLREDVGVLPPSGQLAFGEHSFDWVVVASGVLTAMSDEEGFVHECHRVLRPAGQMALSVPHQKPFSLVNPLRRAVEGEKFGGGRSASRTGYTERDLFLLLRTGFDVLTVRTYVRFWVELVRLWAQSRIRRGDDILRIERRAAWLYRIAHQCDYLGRGHVLMTHGRSRQWKRRTLPVLSDGRSIHEAVLKRTGH